MFSFGSLVISTGFVNTFNGGFNNARSINAGSFLQSNIQTNKNQGQELSTLDDESKNKPSRPVISFVIPSYASGITHLLDLNGKLPEIPVPSDEVLPPIGLKSSINNDNEINSGALLTTTPQNLMDFISTTISPTFPMADNNNYNLSNATPVSLSSKTNIEATANPVTVRPIEKLAVAQTIESTTSAIPGIFFTTKSADPQNMKKISQQNLLSTDSFQETITLSPEARRRLLILGEQKTPGYAVRSDGSIDSALAFPYTTAVPKITVPSFRFEKRPITTNIAATTFLPQTKFANLNDNPFLPPLPVQSSVVNNKFNTQNGTFYRNSNKLSKPRANNLFQTTHSPLFANNVFSTSTNSSEPLKYTSPSNPFDAFKFTVSGFQKTTTLSPIVQKQPTHASLFASTTNSLGVFTANETTILNPVLKENPNGFTLKGIAANFASNVSVAQPPKAKNGFELSKNIPVPDNNPFLPPLAPIIGIKIPNFKFNNQVNIRNEISVNENQIHRNNPENSQATSSSVKHLAPSSGKTIIGSFPNTLNPFAAFKFTLNGLHKNTATSPIVQPTHTPLFSRTTGSESKFTAIEITTETSDSDPTVKPNASSLSRFATNSTSNVSAPQPPKVQNGIEISKDISAPDNDPFLPPLAPIAGIATTTMVSEQSNFAIKNQVNNPENIQTISSSSVNHLASSTEKSIIDIYRRTSKPFPAISFRSSNDSSNNQTFDNPTTTLTDQISNNNEINTTDISNPTLIEESTIQPTSQTLSMFFEPVTDSIAVETPHHDLLPPKFPNNDLLPPLSAESSTNFVKNETTNSSLEIINNNPFLPTLDINPFLAPFSSNQAQTVPQQISSIPSLDDSTTTKPNVQYNFPSKFDNSALRNNFFTSPITQVKDFKYTGGFGAPPGILSPHDKSFNK